MQREADLAAHSADEPNRRDFIVIAAQRQNHSDFQLPDPFRDCIERDARSIISP